MLSRWEAVDVSADLGEQDFGRPLPDAGDRVQALDFVRHRAQSRSDFLTELLDQLAEPIQVRQLLPEQKALMCRELSGECAF